MCITAKMAGFFKLWRDTCRTSASIGVERFEMEKILDWKLYKLRSREYHPEIEWSKSRTLRTGAVYLNIAVLIGNLDCFGRAIKQLFFIGWAEISTGCLDVLLLVPTPSSLGTLQCVGRWLLRTWNFQLKTILKTREGYAESPNPRSVWRWKIIGWIYLVLHAQVWCAPFGWLEFFFKPDAVWFALRHIAYTRLLYTKRQDLW